MSAVREGLSADPPMLVEITSDVTWGRDLLGGKACSLVRLLALGAAVPPAVTITTHAVRAADDDPAVLDSLIAEAVTGLERRTGRTFGGHAGGLVVSVRSGAPVSMPGMMDTVLNVGIAPARHDGDPLAAFRLDARERFLWQFAESVVGLSDEAREQVRQLLPDACDGGAGRVVLLESLLADRARDLGRTWPAGSREELRDAVHAVASSWNSDRARLYRRMRGIDEDLGTAVTIQAMVFGNWDQRSGSGVVFSRDPRSGKCGLVGEYLSGGQGEDVVSGRATPADIRVLMESDPAVYERLAALAARLETDGRAVQEIEFTVQSGELFVLQARSAKLTPYAAATVAVELAEHGIFDRAQALEYAASHGFDPNPRATSCVAPGRPVSGRGLAVGGGVAVGRVVISERDVQKWAAERGEPIVFVTNETSPKHLAAMKKAAAIVTMRGGVTSHAAVVARELRSACVVGVGGLLQQHGLQLDDLIEVGELLTVDGDTGALYRGDVTVPSTTEHRAEQLLREWAGRPHVS